MKYLILLTLLLSLPVAQAVTFTEDFESYNIVGLDVDLKPDQDWYNYRELDDIGNVTGDAPIPEGLQAFRFIGGVGADVSKRSARFALEIPAQLTETTFNITGTPPGINTLGSMQYVAIESSAPNRKVVEYYIFCTNATFSNGCEFRVRFENIDTTGQVLIPADQNLTNFKVRTVFDWLDAEFCLFVNGVDDGCFPMLQLPQNVGRLRFNQYRADIPWVSTFDDWTVVGAINGTSGTDGDIAEGLKDFAADVHFTSGGSLFVFGFVWFIILSAAVIVPVITFSRSNALIPGVAFYEFVLVLWMIHMEWWPDWIGIMSIIIAGTIISLALRRWTLGMTTTSGNAGLVVASLGYFIITSSMLGFSGYASDTVTIPTDPSIQTTVNTTENPDQSWATATAECIITGGVFTFGLRGDCSTKTVSKTFSQVVDLFGWVRASLDFLWQLVTFTLPIATIFNMMIVLPPAVGLVMVSIIVGRGSS